MGHYLKILGTLAAITFAVAAPKAQADYAVLRSGVRLHITSYEQIGDRVRLTMEGGTVEVPASELASVEPEDTFRALPAAPAPVGLFGSFIQSAAQKTGLNETVIRQVIAAESNFNPRAVSRKKAQGLMQLMPQTSAKFSVTNVFDPSQNIDAGSRYLKSLVDRYRGDLRLALAAYNAGPDAVDRFGGVPPYPETIAYVHRITTKLANDKAPSPQK